MLGCVCVCDVRGGGVGGGGSLPNSAPTLLADFGFFVIRSDDLCLREQEDLHVGTWAKVRGRGLGGLDERAGERVMIRSRHTCTMQLPCQGGPGALTGGSCLLTHCRLAYCTRRPVGEADLESGLDPNLI